MGLEDETCAFKSPSIVTLLPSTNSLREYISDLFGSYQFVSWMRIWLQRLDSKSITDISGLKKRDFIGLYIPSGYLYTCRKKFNILPVHAQSRTNITETPVGLASETTRCTKNSSGWTGTRCWVNFTKNTYEHLVPIVGCGITQDELFLLEEKYGKSEVLFLFMCLFVPTLRHSIIIS